MTQAPDLLTGPVGTAERLDPALNTSPTILDAWFLDLPPAHPYWPRYLLAVIHLRPEPGLSPARLQYPEATHELALVALDPGRHPQPNQPETWRHITPPNIVYQFHGLPDAAAAALARVVALHLVEGRLWAEPSDIHHAREQWTSCLDAAVRDAQTRPLQ